MDDDYRNILAQTAALRFSVASRGLRRLLRGRGVDPMRCLQLSCNQGDDVKITLVIPDGVLVNADYREHYRTRQAIRFVEWTVENEMDSEAELCRDILSDAVRRSRFDEEVRRYFYEHVAATDRPLPPLAWGDRMWHAFEDPPPP